MDTFKPFEKLTFKEKMVLQNLYKKEKKTDSLTDDETELLNNYREIWQQEERKSKAQRPIIIFLIISAVLSILYKQM